MVLKGLLGPEEIIDLIIEENGIDVYSTELLDVEGLREGSRVFSVRTPYKRLRVYIVDTREGAQIATRPEIVGSEFFELNRRAALDAAVAIRQLAGLGRPAVLLHILRASLGYRLHEALRKLGIPFSEAFVRVKYVVESYRAHTQREVRVVYRKFEDLPGEDTALIVADTVATGRTLGAAVRTACEELQRRGAGVEKLVIYGFLAWKGIERVYQEAQELGIRDVYAFAMQDVTPLAYNDYDMPLYGPDESLWSEKGRLEMLGATVDIATLERMLPEYAPGMDQPGDWSERQDVLFNGHSYEPGDVEGHLRKSLELLRKLRELSKRTSWYSDRIEKIFEYREIMLLKALKSK